MKNQRFAISAVCLTAAFLAASAPATVIWQNIGPVTVSNGVNQPVSFNAAALTTTRDDTASDTLYFRATITPYTDYNNENYYAGFQLFQSGGERFAVGNNWGAHAWSVFGGGVNADLNSSNPESGQVWQLVDRTDPPVTLLYRVDYAAGASDNITVWLNPINDTEVNQPANLTTTFAADASFDEIRLRIGNEGTSWTYGDMGMTTTFSEAMAIPEPGVAFMLAIGAGALLLRRRLRVA